MANSALTSDSLDIPSWLIGPRGRIAKVLKEHWLTSIECHHDRATDTAHCFCSTWKSQEQPSVGAAVQAWIDHVLEQL